MMLFVVVDLGRVVAHQAHLLDVLYHLGMFKLYINITKYVPQVCISTYMLHQVL